MTQSQPPRSTPAPFGALAFGAALLMAAAGTAATAQAADMPVVRLGILQFGTVNWEVDVIQNHGLDQANGVKLDVLKLANKNGTAIALNGGEVDMIVTDWLWVSRQRDAGFDYTFVPYSEAAGAVMVHPDSGIDSLADLDGKTFGVSGGSVDKSWLLIRAYGLKTLGRDLADMVHPAFGAPPLLQHKFINGEFDGVLNFWNYTARLDALGMKTLIKVQDVLPALGVPGRLPLIGYVFSEKWAAENPKALQGFLAASAAAREIMVESDDEWERLRPLTKAEDDATLVALRDGFRAGVPKSAGPETAASIGAAFAIIAKLGGRELVGNSTELAPGTVWNGAR